MAKKWIGFRNANARDINLSENQVKILSEHGFVASDFGGKQPLIKGMGFFQKTYTCKFMKIELHVHRFDNVEISNYGQDWIKAYTLDSLNIVYEVMEQIKEDLKLLRRLGIIK